MNAMNQLFHCNVCGQEVRVVRPGPGALYCCGEAMVPVEEADEDKSEESE
ncbi:MAG: desulfoferrodoxin FeS4 iron-binding domain-containing protein [Planctomycetes bacterium]|nr:desulfoferrodoxin FeS4 iron-binding domain-containing protein [Planctomycetota bacterium]